VPSPPPAPEEDRGDAWEPPEAGAGAPAAEPAKASEWDDFDELPF